MQSDQPTHSKSVTHGKDAPQFSAFFKPRFAIEKINIKFALAHSQGNVSGLPPSIPKIPYVAVAEHYAFGLLAPQSETHENVPVSTGPLETQSGSSAFSESAPVRQDELDNWGMDFSAAIAMALEQLKENMPHAPFELAVPGVYMAATGNHNPASLLLTDLINRLPICGKAVAIVAHENQIVMAGSSDPTGLKALLEITRELIASPGGMLALPMILEPGGWAPFSLPLNHELFEDFDRLLGWNFESNPK